MLQASLISVRVCFLLNEFTKGTCPHVEAARKAHELKFAEPEPAKFDYEAFYSKELDKKHKDKSYRYFNNINRVSKHMDYFDFSLLVNFPMPTLRIRMNVFVFGERMTTSACPVIP